MSRTGSVQVCCLAPATTTDGARATAREYETAVVVVTHNRQLAARADRVLLLEDGRLTTVGSVDAIP